MMQGGTTYRLITDQVGSVRLVVNTSTGAVAERIDWGEFGTVLSDPAPGSQPFGFAGGLRDIDTGLTRFGARDYDALTGRWTAKDPLQFRTGTPNLYSYSQIDPLNFIDASGLKLLVDPGTIAYYGPDSPSVMALQKAFESLNYPGCDCAISGEYGSPPWASRDITVGLSPVPGAWFSASGLANPLTGSIWIDSGADPGTYAEIIAHEAGHFRWPYLGHSNPSRFFGEYICGSLNYGDENACQSAPACGLQ